MVIRDFDFPCIPLVPFEADAILAIDSDRVLSSPISGESVESIRRRGQLAGVRGRVDLVELRARLGPEDAGKFSAGPFRIRSFEDRPRFPIPEGPDHVSQCNP